MAIVAGLTCQNDTTALIGSVSVGGQLHHCPPTECRLSALGHQYAVDDVDDPVVGLDVDLGHLDGVP